MSKYEKFYEAREKIIEIVSDDLLGPVEKNEVINESPLSYYLMGKLYPRTEMMSVDDSNTTSAYIESAEADESLSSTNMREPSAMGMTITVKNGVCELGIAVKYAIYEPYSLEKAQEAKLDISCYEKIISEAGEKEKDRMTFWKRNEKAKEFILPTEKDSRIELEKDIYIKSFMHMETRSGERIITIVFTNERKTESNEYNKQAENAILQPEICVFSPKNEDIFAEVRRQVELNNNDELRELEMLYSEKTCYAQGHGCSVIWDMDSQFPTYIKTSFLPTYNLQQMKAAEIEENPVFNMYYLHTGSKEAIIGNLHKFLSKYEEWIDDTDKKIESSQYRIFADTAKINISECRNILSRIQKSIDLLDEDSARGTNAWRSFVYANEAMYLQRCRSIMKRTGIFDYDEIDSSNINWYPFQLAFVLLEISSFVEPEGNDRKLVDLLWFPTGGGKTEAYLGIAAFSIFYRRISEGNKGNGLSIIMRYTLRLLTIQQFERASMLICACEKLRKKYDIPGEEITIGLWVGNNFTPGTLEDADTVLTKIMATGMVPAEETDPCQIKICPWCGKKLYPKNYQVKMQSKRMEICCKNEECDFFNIPLPVRVVDEEIYNHRPTFLVATVDKFAQIAIQEKTSALFSVDNDNLPPELIIQDELHLISGPLGTMTGIYEAAITKICEHEGRPMKIVASTATIRNASKQILSLYGRDYNQFPPQGINADDSFFAVKAKVSEKPARLYAGIMGVGTTFTTTLIRLYASWLFASRYLVDLGYDEKVVDSFWSLTGYFNSIRELGATQTQIVDDIQSRYKYLKENKFKNKYANFSGENRYENSVELTSRMSNDEISEIIQEKLKVSYTHEEHDEVYDFVLASNMISVGVDVGRLGVMAVAGQSKTNAEYIQATSRVGRDNPGLVFTVYNAVRSRDRSHYEQFSKYHSALYRYVEATSLTPFSDRARDRGLQALFVILCRYYCPQLLHDDAAGNFSPDLEEVKEVERLIYNYVNIVDSREKDKVLAELKDIERKWYDAAQVGELWYKKKNKPSLLDDDTEKDSRFRIMNSMRSVEQESGIYLLGETE